MFFCERSVVLERKIIHIDMDSFFVSVEQRDCPELRGKPCAVGGLSDRGVLATASYEARRFGVHSAMSTRRAMELCPELVVVPGDYQKYKEVSEQVHAIFHEYTDVVEPLSLDEAFLDVTVNKRGMVSATEVAQEIRAKIWERLHLTASAGVSYCKFLAKVASDWKKPDGLFVIRPSEALRFISFLRVEKFWGVGAVTAEHMHRMGIYCGWQLRDWSLEGLTREFGKAGQMYYNFARGIDERPVEPVQLRKSVGCETTFERDIYRRSAVVIELYHLAEELLRRLKAHPFRGYTLTLKVKFFDFTQITRSKTSRTEAFDTMECILPASKALMAEVDYSRERPIRLLGLSVSHAREEHEVWKQLELDFGKGTGQRG
ncbi:MAG: DNA polymerase IV [Bacteroidaceae bacterium]|nr:DNA polymerase IV [Bacteroidaceae bacterium]MBQ9642342.1 DNA polymerase IV [Bacteroidaceae bacterium]